MHGGQGLCPLLELFAVRLAVTVYAAAEAGAAGVARAGRLSADEAQVRQRGAV